MADYFTNFSLNVLLPSKAAKEYAISLAEQAAAIQQAEEAPAAFPPVLRSVVEDWHFETEAANRADASGVWLHSSCGGLDAVCAFIQHLLQRFDPAESVGVEWSNDCSKPRTDAYGGGAAFITAKQIKSITTGRWLQTQEVRHRNHNNPPPTVR